MKVIFQLSALAAFVSAQTGIFEPADFNVTRALIANGVNVSAIPELAALTERSLLSECSIAVSFRNHTCFVLRICSPIVSALPYSSYTVATRFCPKIRLRIMHLLGHIGVYSKVP